MQLVASLSCDASRLPLIACQLLLFQAQNVFIKEASIALHAGHAKAENGVESAQRGSGGILASPAEPQSSLQEVRFKSA